MKPAALNAQVERELEFADNRAAQQLFGDLNRNLQTVEQATGVAINARGNSLQISGRAHAVELAAATLEQMYGLILKGYPVFSQDIAFGVKILESSPKARLEEIFLDKVCITSRKGADPETSWTAKLLSKGPEKCAEKFGEEAVEAIIEAVKGDRAKLTSEAADVVFHLAVMLAARDLTLADVAEELARREGQSGIAEKATRG